MVEGKVEALLPYGALVQLDRGGIVAMLHISQISQERFEAVEDVFSEGDRIKASTSAAAVS